MLPFCDHEYYATSHACDFAMKFDEHTISLATCQHVLLDGEAALQVKLDFNNHGHACDWLYRALLEVFIVHAETTNAGVAASRACVSQQKRLMRAGRLLAHQVHQHVHHYGAADAIDIPNRKVFDLVPCNSWVRELHDQ